MTSHPPSSSPPPQPTASPAPSPSPSSPSPSSADAARETFTITFGERAETHVGMNTVGTASEAGLSPAELLEARRRFDELVDEGGVPGAGVEWYALNNLLRGDDAVVSAAHTCAEDAALLVVRRGADLLLGAVGKTADDALAEQRSQAYDKVAFMYGRVVNKKARYNLCFGDEAQEGDCANKKGTVVSYAAVPVAAYLRDRLPTLLGAKAEGLKAEGNHYYDAARCGIGYHGDAERKIVVGVRLGASLPLCYSWFQRSKPVGEKLTLTINHGDLYVMSEKTTGFDHKLRTKPTLRHAAGCAKYTKLPAAGAAAAE